MSPTTRERVTILDTTLSELAERLAKLDARERELEKRLAKGSGDHTEASALINEFAAEEPTIPGRRRPVAGEENAEAVLREHPCSSADLGRALGTSAAETARVVSRLRKAKHLVNVGSIDAPRWSWFVGPECSTDQLYAAIEGLITDRPFTFAELMQVTGNPRGRVTSILANLERKGRKIMRLGTPARQRWFIAKKR